MSMNIEMVALDTLILDPANARLHSSTNLEGIKGSLAKFGQQKPIVVGADNVVIAGNGQLEAARALGWEKIQIVRSELRGSDATAFGIADNATGLSSEWDDERLSSLIASLRDEDYEMGALGLSEDELAAILDDASEGGGASSGEEAEEARQTLQQRFGVPPFSVLDARQGYWQERKNAWLAMGLRSNEGRGENLAYDNAGAKPPAFYALRNEMRAQSGVDPSWEQINEEARKRGMMSAAVEGTSIFDPVLAELAYRWFCPPDGWVLDPFAGGSVRGIVAQKLGRKYFGVDLRDEQVEANKAIWRELSGSTVPIGEIDFNGPRWMTGDSTQLDKIAGVLSEGVDFVFSCPPYADLEVYSDDERDLSNMSYEDFLAGYRKAIGHSIALLRDDRFACFVVGDVRDKKGIYRNFVSHPIQAFEDAGAQFYNDAILVTMASSAAIRAGRPFEGARKLCKVHQNVLVFIKGDPKKATDAVGPCEWGDISGGEPE